MRKRLLEDAAAWEAGELTLEEFERRHPREHIRALADLSLFLSAAVQGTTPDPDAGWVALRDRLPDRTSTSRPRPWRARRSLVAVVAAALLAGTSVAYAADVGPVRHGVDRVVQGVTRLFGGDEQGGHGDTKGTTNQSGGPAHSETHQSGADDPEPVANEGEHGAQGETGHDGASHTGSGDEGPGETGEVNTGVGHQGAGGTDGEAAGEDQGGTDQVGADESHQANPGTGEGGAQGGDTSAESHGRGDGPNDGGIAGTDEAGSDGSSGDGGSPEP